MSDRDDGLRDWNDLTIEEKIAFAQDGYDCAGPVGIYARQLFIRNDDGSLSIREDFQKWEPGLIDRSSWDIKP